MDILFFLKNRTTFIRNYYETASAPFIEKMQKIEKEEPPYVPDFYEHGDNGPAFQPEWNEAKDSLELLGLSCISMLSESLKLYFTTWRNELHIKISKEGHALFKEKGFFAGYRAVFEECVGVEWARAPADLGIIEQIVLARNRAQHPDHISSLSSSHSTVDLQKYPSPYFVSQYDTEKSFDKDFDPIWWTPQVHVSKDQLYASIEQVEALAEWLEDKMFTAKYPKSSHP